MTQLRSPLALSYPLLILEVHTAKGHFVEAEQTLCTLRDATGRTVAIKAPFFGQILSDPLPADTTLSSPQDLLEIVEHSQTAQTPTPTPAPTPEAPPTNQPTPDAGTPPKAAPASADAKSRAARRAERQDRLAASQIGNTKATRRTTRKRNARAKQKTTSTTNPTPNAAPNSSDNQPKDSRIGIIGVLLFILSALAMFHVTSAPTEVQGLLGWLLILAKGLGVTFVGAFLALSLPPSRDRTAAITPVLLLLFPALLIWSAIDHDSLTNIGRKGRDMAAQYYSQTGLPLPAPVATVLGFGLGGDITAADHRLYTLHIRADKLSTYADRDLKTFWVETQIDHQFPDAFLTPFEQKMMADLGWGEYEKYGRTRPTNMFGGVPCGMATEIAMEKVQAANDDEVMANWFFSKKAVMQNAMHDLTILDLQGKTKRRDELLQAIAFTCINPPAFLDLPAQLSLTALQLRNSITSGYEVDPRRFDLLEDGLTEAAADSQISRDDLDSALITLRGLRNAAARQNDS